MNDRTHNPMIEAIRLTREGKLHDATNRIQRNLAGLHAEDDAVVCVAGIRPVPDPLVPEHRLSGSIAQVNGRVPVDVGTTLGRALHGLPSELSHRRVGARAAGIVPSTSTGDSGGGYVAGSVTCGAGTRSYRLYIPKGRAGEPLPLVVLLHGCTQDAVDLARGTRMNALADRERFLVLYPEQSTNANGQRCWNWFKKGDQARDAGEPSIIAAMTRQIMTTHAVDADRVYVAGMSAGGSMAAIMGATYPDVYAAVGVHSGLPYRSAHDLPSAFAAMRSGANGQHVSPGVSMIVFHGSADTTVHPSNADMLLGPSRDGGRPSIETGRALGGHAYKRAVYRDGERDVEQWMVEGAGHAWSGGSPDGSFTDARGPNASAEMLRFFREHPRKR